MLLVPYMWASMTFLPTLQWLVNNYYEERLNVELTKELNSLLFYISQASVVQRTDNVTHWIRRYTAKTCGHIST